MVLISFLVLYAMSAIFFVNLAKYNHIFGIKGKSEV